MESALGQISEADEQHGHDRADKEQAHGGQAHPEQAQVLCPAKVADI